MRAQRSGRIIFISSVLGFLPGPFVAYYAANKHAIEAYSESLDHEVRTLGIRALLIEPAFIRTRIDENGAVAVHKLDAYAAMRGRSDKAVSAAVEAGDDPKVVAIKVLEAARVASPHLRYPVAKGASQLALMRKFMPPSLLSWGFRRNFGLDG